MACWNRVTAHILEDLPRSQVEDLCYARKTPLIYGRAVLNNWHAFADANIGSVSPRGNSLFWDSTRLQAGHEFGTVYGPTPAQPDQPAVLNFTVVPTDHDATPQLAAYEGGRKRLLRMSFRDLERALIDVLDRSVNRAGGDFEPQRDLALDHDQPLELRLRARADVGVGPVAVRAVGGSAAGAGAPAAAQRVDRQQRLGGVRLHPQRDQRGLPGGAGSARIKGPPGRGVRLEARWSSSPTSSPR